MQPALPKSIPHAVAVAAHRAPDSVAVVDGDRRVSYRELHALMLSAASSFVRAGIEPRDRVAIWVPNSLDWIVACTGAQAAGAVVVPINTRFKTAEASFVLNRSRARVLVVVDRFVDVSYPDLLREIDLPASRTHDPCRPGGRDCTPSGPSFSRIGRRDVRRASRSQSIDSRRSTEPRPSDILFTSGTTGEPKGVVTNHRQNLQVYEQWANVTGLRADDRYAIVFPFVPQRGLQGRLCRVPDSRRHDVPAIGVRTVATDGPRRELRKSPCCPGRRRCSRRCSPRRGPVTGASPRCESQ
jgi:acyl-CoA synthetase (AMP-forming)/AMP-acid ligase II